MVMIVPDARVALWCVVLFLDGERPILEVSAHSSRLVATVMLAA